MQLNEPGIDALAAERQRQRFQFRDGTARLPLILCEMGMAGVTVRRPGVEPEFTTSELDEFICQFSADGFKKFERLLKKANACSNNHGARSKIFFIRSGVYSTSPSSSARLSVPTTIRAIMSL